MNCRINRGQEWSYRLLNEMKYWNDNIFLTLTYENYLGPLIKKDVQDFLKRLRIKLGERKVKYYFVGEYGDTFGRAHYHAIIFGLSAGDEKLINDCWGKGFIYIGSVTEQSINYVTKYINKKLYGKEAKKKYGEMQMPFAIMSKKMGLRFLEENKEHFLINVGMKKKGKLVPMPRYYKKKLTELTPELLDDKLVQDSEKRLAYLDEEGRFKAQLAKPQEDRFRREKARLESEYWEDQYKDKF